MKAVPHAYPAKRRAAPCTTEHPGPAVPARGNGTCHQGLNTLAFLLPLAGGGGLYLFCRRSAPRRAASIVRWTWAGVGFYAACYLLLALGAWFLY